MKPNQEHRWSSSKCVFSSRYTLGPSSKELWPVYCWVYNTHKSIHPCEQNFHIVFTMVFLIKVETHSLPLICLISLSECTFCVSIIFLKDEINVTVRVIKLLEMLVISHYNSTIKFMYFWVQTDILSCQCCVFIVFKSICET